MQNKKAVLITGAAKRVGREVALTFADKGYDIALHYNNSEEEALKTQQEIVAKDVQCSIFQCDLEEIRNLPAFIDRVFDAFPHCNALINNASVFERATFAETNEELFDQMLGINLKSPFFMIQHFVKRCPKARIVNILDTNIHSNHTSHCAYLLAKKSLASLTKMAAWELAPDARVNGICPGMVIPAAEESGRYEVEYRNKVPLKQNTSLREMAESVCFLVESETITGELLNIDSGKHLL